MLQWQVNILSETRLCSTGSGRMNKVHQSHHLKMKWPGLKTSWTQVLTYLCGRDQMLWWGWYCANRECIFSETLMHLCQLKAVLPFGFQHVTYCIYQNVRWGLFHNLLSQKWVLPYNHTQSCWIYWHVFFWRLKIAKGVFLMCRIISYWGKCSIHVSYPCTYYIFFIILWLVNQFTSNAKTFSIWCELVH